MAPAPGGALAKFAGMEGEVAGGGAATAIKDNEILCGGFARSSFLPAYSLTMALKKLSDIREDSKSMKISPEQ
jgi:hypothetical protein